MLIIFFVDFNLLTNWELEASQSTRDGVDDLHALKSKFVLEVSIPRELIKQESEYIYMHKYIHNKGFN